MYGMHYLLSLYCKGRVLLLITSMVVLAFPAINCGQKIMLVYYGNIVHLCYCCSRTPVVKHRPVDSGMSFINHNSDAYDDVKFDDKKPLVATPAKGSGEDLVVQNPVVTSE